MLDSLQAEALFSVGLTTEALSTIDAALHLAERTGETFWQAELHRLKGDFLYRQGTAPEQASYCYQQAIDIARTQEAKMLELRATTSLCRWLQTQRKYTEARQRLAAIYGWFTEGFDTIDLQEAKALLDELNSFLSG